MNLNPAWSPTVYNDIACLEPALPVSPLPVDKGAPAPYGLFDKDFIVQKGIAYIDVKVAEELVAAARELREWMSQPNGSLSEPMSQMVTETLEGRLSQALKRMESSIRKAEKAVEDAEADEESEE